MTKLWSIFANEESLATGFHIPSHAKAEELAFLDYDTITQEQIVDIDDFGSFISGNVSASSGSSEEKTGQKSRSDFNQLALEVKTLKERYVRRWCRSKIAFLTSWIV